MRLVIDIDEHTYETIINGGTVWSVRLCNTIRNGTPLPKGHGRLIAEPTEEEIEKTIGGQSNFAECIRDIVKTVFDNVPTIIKADGGGEE